MTVMLKLRKIKCKSPNARWRENCNFHKLAAILAIYGFNSVRLSDDWEGVDFLAYHINGNDTLKVQLKGRLEINKKYAGKNIYMAFPLKGAWCLVPHDELMELAAKMKPSPLNAKTWKEKGVFNQSAPSEEWREALKEFKL